MLRLLGVTLHPASAVCLSFIVPSSGALCFGMGCHGLDVVGDFCLVPRFFFFFLVFAYEHIVMATTSVLVLLSRLRALCLLASVAS